MQPAEIAPLAAESLTLGLAQAGNRLIAVGERGHILISDDAGESWRQVPAPVDITLTDVHFVDARRGWAVGHDGVILHSSDAGESWTLQYLDRDRGEPLLTVVFVDRQTGFATGAYGRLLQTDDGGASWQDGMATDSDPHWYALTPLAPGAMMIAGEFGEIALGDARTTDWRFAPTDYDGTFFGGLRLGPASALVFGIQGKLFRTTDAGASWIEIDTGITAGLTAGTTLAGGQIALTGLSGALLLSDDGGRSFTLHRDPQRRGFADIIAPGDRRLVLAGDDGLVTVDLPPPGSTAAIDWPG